jgi:hypothetical protein
MPGPPKAWLPTKAHDRRFTCPDSLRMAPPYTNSLKKPDAQDDAILPANEQLVAFTVPPRLKMAPPLAGGNW